MRTFKILLFLLAAMIFVGCANSTAPRLSLQSSSPIFVTKFSQKDSNASIFMHFKNSANQPNLIESATRAKFEKNGFVLVADQDVADVVILGDLMSFERINIKDPRVFLNVGYGFGSFGRRSSMGVGMVFGDPFYDDFYDTRTNSYVYKANVSLFIKTKEREQTAILSVESDKNVYSPSYIMPFIEERIATQILNFFY